MGVGFKPLNVASKGIRLSLDSKCSNSKIVIASSLSYMYFIYQIYACFWRGTHKFIIATFLIKMCNTAYLMSSHSGCSMLGYTSVKKLFKSEFVPLLELSSIEMC